MSEEHTVTAAAGTSRRDFIKRTAIATGAVWAAPSLMSVGPRALGADGSEICPESGLLVFKYELAQDGTNMGTFVIDLDKDNYNVTDCGFPGSESEVETAIANESTSPRRLSISADESTLFIDGQQVIQTEYVDAVTGKYEITFTIPDGCNLGGVSAKSGGSCSELVEENGNTFTVSDIVADDGIALRDVSNVSVLICCIPTGTT